MVSPAVQSSFPAIGGSLEAIAALDSRIQVQFIDSMNTALDLVTIGGVRRSQFAHMTGKYSDPRPVHLTWDINQELSALGLAPGDTLPDRLRFDLAREEVPPAVAILTASFTYLVVDSNQHAIQDGALGLNVPRRLGHDPKFPYVKVHQHLTHVDRFDMNRFVADASAGLTPASTSFWNSLDKCIDDFELSVRASNCLQNANIKYVGELVQKTRTELRKIKNFGRKTIDEVVDVILTPLGLSLDMDVRGWTPPSK